MSSAHELPSETRLPVNETRDSCRPSNWRILQRRKTECSIEMPLATICVGVESLDADLVQENVSWPASSFRDPVCIFGLPAQGRTAISSVYCVHSSSQGDISLSRPRATRVAQVGRRRRTNTPPPLPTCSHTVRAVFGMCVRHKHEKGHALLWTSIEISD